MGLGYLWVWSILSLLKPKCLHSNKYTESHPVQIIEPTFTNTFRGYFNPVTIRQIILAPV